MNAGLCEPPWKPCGNAVNAEHQDNIESKGSDSSFKKIVLEGQCVSQYQSVVLSLC